jgi:hypothetical protein
LSALLLAVAPGAQAQTTLRVPLDYPTIQFAIDAAVNGDTVLVAPGRYVENINFLGKAITVAGESGPETTLIDGNQGGPVVEFSSGEARSSALVGFTLLNGKDRNGSGGGGILIRFSSPTIRGNIIANNRACSGVGIAADFASPLIIRNNIINNRQAGCTGGGGGGVDIGGASRAEIVENFIAGNIMPYGDGGGINLSGAGDPVIRGNIISRNASQWGGGIAMGNQSRAVMVQNLVVGNRAPEGGGIYTLSIGWLAVNNTIVDNDSGRGSALFAYGSQSSSQLYNNVIAGRDGQYAVHCENSSGGMPVFRFNNVFSSGAAAFGPNCVDPTGANGNASADPLFADRPRGDYRLQEASPSIDGGYSTAPQLPGRDADGNARVQDGNGDAIAVVDAGAYERGGLLTPGAHDFGPARLGAAPVSATFRIANPGAITLAVSAISVGSAAVGAGSFADFAVAPGGPDPCPGLAPSLGPGQSCSVAVTFTPPATFGRKSATLRVDSDAAGSPALAILSADVAVETTLIAVPGARTVSALATFAFVSDVGGSSFECRREWETVFTACTSPLQYIVGPGAHRLEVRALSELGDPDPTPAVFEWTSVFRAVRADFNGDGRADILWRNTSTGENYLYPMDGTTILGTEGYLRTVSDQSWQVAGVGDFDGDGRMDILWRNSATGQNYIYLMNGTVIAGEGYIRTVADQAWQVAGIGDFDGDGKDDILWRRASSGENYVFPMDGLGVRPNEGYLRTVADAGWQVAGVGDFNGDRKADILWRHASSGENYVYLMSGTAIAGEGYLRTVADTAWQVKGVADLTGDGRADVVWRHAVSGETYLYTMFGTLIADEGYLRMIPDPAWQIVALGDYDGDGRSDLLWRNSATGENYIWPMSGRIIKPTESYIRTVAPGGWNVIGR